jgi:DNA-binding LacI/PurR family transcriptional regulator
MHGYDLLISFQQLSGNWLADFQDSKKADGIILLGYGDYIEYLLKLEQLVDQGTRFVRWGAVLPGQPGISIGCDNHEGGRCATRHLLDIGRRRIAFLGQASEHYPEFLERYRGHVEMLEEYGLTVSSTSHVDAVSTERAGYEGVRELLARGEKFDAIFCASDLIAIGAMRALQEQGIRIPEDVAVTGFDDVPTASFANPALTTVQQDTKLAGQLLVESLLALIHDEPVESQMMPAKLVLRRSTGG